MRPARGTIVGLDSPPAPAPLTPLAGRGHADGDPAEARPFLRRAVVAASVAAAVAAAFFLAWQLIWVLAVAFAAVLLAVFLRAGADLVSRLTRVRPGWGLAIFVIALVAAVVATGLIGGPVVADQVQRLTEQVPKSVEAVRGLLGRYAWAGQLVDAVGRSGSQDLGEMARRAGGMLFTAVGALGTAVVVAFTGLYLAVDPGLYRRGALHLVPFGHRERADRTMGRVGYALEWWLIGQFASMSIVGGLSWLGLWLLGVPLAFLCALLTMLLTFVPNFGPVLSVIPPALLALSAEGAGPASAGYVVLLYLAIQTFESYLITPVIQQKSVEMPPALLILAQVLMGVLLGILGIALAAPLLAAVMVAVSELYVRPVLKDPTHAIDQPGD